MGYPWPKHVSTPETIWTKAEDIEKYAGDYENLSTNVWRAHGPAREGVAGMLSGAIDDLPDVTRRDAFRVIQAAVIGAASTRRFGDAVLIFNQEVAEINELYENAEANDFYGETARSTEKELAKHYETLVSDRDTEAEECAGMLESDPTEAEILQWVRVGALPPGAAAAFPEYDFSGLPEFEAWKLGHEFPATGADRRTWATFFGPGPAGAEAITAQVGQPGEDHGIIYGRYFISKNDAAWPADLLGDNRGFTSDPNASYRIAFAYDTATGEMSYTVSGSTTTAGEGMDARDIGYTALPWTNAYPRVVQQPDGRIQVTMHAVNPQTPAGAVDTVVTIDPDDNYARVRGDDYPDVELYRQNPDGTVTTIGTDEMSRLDGAVTLPPFINRDEEWGVTDDDDGSGPSPTPDPTPSPSPGTDPTPDPTPSPSPGPDPNDYRPADPDWEER